MKLSTYSTARQRLAEVLEEAPREGEVQIRRQDGRVYAVTPVAEPSQSPFGNVTGRAVTAVTSRELLRLRLALPLLCDGDAPSAQQPHYAQSCATATVPLRQLDIATGRL
jgi:hypothetical protein